MSNTFTEMTARIVSAYLRGNSVPSAAVPDVINSVYGAISQAEAIKEEAVEPSAPAVPVRSSVKPDYIVCLECGQKAKILRRHLESRHGLTAGAYREKWRLPKSYPLVAPNYAERRNRQVNAVRERFSASSLNGIRARPPRPSMPTFAMNKPRF